MKIKLSSKLRIWLCGLLAVAGIMAAAPAFADLTILPTRVVFEDRDRFAEVTLINTGKEEKTYEVSWRYFQMQQDTGAYVNIDHSLTAFDLGQHVVFSPRHVTLKPHEKQKIRLALRPEADTSAGEYRAHLQIRGEREKAPDDDTPGDGKAHVAVVMNVGYTIPVFYSVGPSDAGATIESLQLERNEKGVLEAVIPITRTGGPYSAHGYLTVYHTGADGKETKVGEVSNAHIFPEVTRRIFRVALTDPNITGGSLHVVYKHYDDAKNMIYDQKNFPVGN